MERWTKKIKVWELKQPNVADQFGGNLDTALSQPAATSDANGMWNIEWQKIWVEELQVRRDKKRDGGGMMI